MCTERFDNEETILVVGDVEISIAPEYGEYPDYDDRMGYFISKWQGFNPDGYLWYDEYGNMDNPADIAKFMDIKQRDLVYLPFYYAGDSISTSGWSQMGVIFTTRQRIRELYGIKKVTQEHIDRARKEMIGQIKRWDTYLTEGTWGIAARDTRTGEIIDSVWGFVGIEEAKEAGMEYMSHHIRKASEKHIALQSAARG